MLAHKLVMRIKMRNNNDIVDDFLAGSLIGHKEYGEAASRYILGCILGREIGKLNVVTQKFLTADNPKTHGIRLDVYLDEQTESGEAGEIFDIEPDKNSRADDIATLPRRARFYHAKIDGSNLKIGDSYDKLRRVIVIFIMPYDPLGYNRMMYTIRNCCVEDYSIPYDDGNTTIFLYTRGTEGNPPERLQQLLHYMENSTADNACTKELQELHKMVVAVKQDGEVGLAYMKSFEIEAQIRRESEEVGIERGIEIGEKRGREEGRQEGINGIISVARRLGQSDADIVKLLQSEMGLAQEEAEEAVAKYTPVK